jgi:hypothetical protein
MTADPYQELSSAKRRRLIYGAALRGLLTATVLVILYYALPDQSWSGDTALRILAGRQRRTGTGDDAGSDA